MKLLRDTAEAILRSWFEAGIAYNLMLGERSKRTELDEFEQCLSHIPPTRRIYAAHLINKAFSPDTDVFEIMMQLQSLGCEMDNVIGRLYCITHNWPHWSWELLTSSKRLVLAPENMLEAYYEVRQALDNTRSLDSEIEVEHPTLKSLKNLAQNRKLTSHLVSFKETVHTNGFISCSVHAHGYFKEKQAGVRRHILEVAQELTRGNDPIKKVKFALLDGKEYRQWENVLQALYCYHKAMTAQSFVKHCRKVVPREYLYAVRDANTITNQLERLSKRQDALTRFALPHDNDYRQNRVQDDHTLNQLSPELIIKMILSHYIMFYLSMLHHLPWSKSLRDCRNELEKRFPNGDEFGEAWNMLALSQKEPWSGIASIDPLYKQIQQLRYSDPIGLPLGMHAPDLIPEPLALLEAYYRTLEQRNKRHRESINRELLDEFVAFSNFDIALMIPKFLNIDTTEWLKPPVMLQQGEPLTIYGSSHLELPDRLHLAGLVESGDYIYQTLTDNLTMSIESLGQLLMGISYHWHVGMLQNISVSRFHEHLSHFSVPEVSPKTLTSRKKLAQNWLDKWPDIGLFNQIS